MLFKIKDEEFIVDFMYSNDVPLLNEADEDEIIRDVTIAKLMKFNRETKEKTTIYESVTIRNPEDRYCKSTARRVAFGRLIGTRPEFMEPEEFQDSIKFDKEERKAFWDQYFSQTNEAHKDGKH